MEQKKEIQKSFDEICYEFQQKITDIFNEERYIPFLMKYYLIKDIWDKIQEHKIQTNMEFTASKNRNYHYSDTEGSVEEENINKEN